MRRNIYRYILVQEIKVFAEEELSSLVVSVTAQEGTWSDDPMITVRIPATTEELYTYPILTTTSQPKVTYNLSENVEVAAVIVIVWKSHTLTVEVRSSASGQSIICQPD